MGETDGWTQCEIAIFVEYISVIIIVCRINILKRELFVYRRQNSDVILTSEFR